LEAQMMAGKFELYKDRKGEFRFRLVASNGQTILSSEGYKQKSNAENGIESVRKNSQVEARFQRKTGSNGQFSFNLMATNGQVVGVSQQYKSEASCVNGIESVRKHAVDAALVDQTV
jgi:uncharacterized protein YegP (UPF0339 family)